VAQKLSQERPRPGGVENLWTIGEFPVERLTLKFFCASDRAESRERRVTGRAFVHRFA